MEVKNKFLIKAKSHQKQAMPKYNKYIDFEYRGFRQSKQVHKKLQIMKIILKGE